MSKKINIPKDNNIIKTPIEEAMPDNYLPYAVEVAKERALPDVRDGLKPVHRRIIYGAYMLKALPDKPYYKSARIVGDILGKYHPHGDSSVYDAMVILAQSFATRMPLIDGHGNWGSIDGDNAAAMRYTEARLAPIAMEMVRDIEKGVVNMVDNYSSSDTEPEVLPSRYPNLLVNGVFGIAVGLATNIPPHNMNEVIDATLAYIDNPDIDTKEILKYIKGPDLPTGGIVIGKNSLLSAYETGEGKVTLRAKTFIEKLENGRLGIVITEFPYRRNKAKLLQLISDMTADKRHAKALEAITDIRDESDRTGIRSVIELRKSVDFEAADKILKYLFKKTDLQCNISFNMVAIAEGKPMTLSLKKIIYHYVNHQKEVVKRRTEKDLQVAKNRHHIVEGFIKAIGIMDEIIKIIRASKSKKDASANLISTFGFSDLQAEAILELMLYRLTGLEIVAFEKEHKELQKLIDKLEKVLASEKELLKVIKNEMTEIKEKYGNERRTEIIDNDEEAKIQLEELVIEEDIVIVMSNEGFIKRIATKNYNRTSTNIEDIEYREGDYHKYLLHSNTKEILMLFTDKGNMYQLKALNIPEYKWKEKGERIDQIVKALDLNNEKVVAFHSIGSFTSQKDLLLITDRANIKKTSVDKFNTNYTKIMAIKLKAEEVLTTVLILPAERQEGFIKINTIKGLSFDIEEPLLEATERNGPTVSMVLLPPEDRVASIDLTDYFNYKSFYASIDKKGIIKTSEKPIKEGVLTNTSSKLYIFTRDGFVYSISSIIISNIAEEINIKSLYSEIEGRNIIKILSFKDFQEEGVILTFTSKGLIKKTSISEFKEINTKSICHKFKWDKDTLVDLYLSKDNSGEALLITKKAMSLRFSIENINTMGRNASGVTAISLTEEDEVIFAAMLKNTNGYINLKSHKKSNEKVAISNIKLSSRATRGKNIMLVTMDDFVKDVTFSKE